VILNPSAANKGKRHCKRKYFKITEIAFDELEKWGEPNENSWCLVAYIFR
jgi:hypothetical protein